MTKSEYIDYLRAQADLPVRCASLVDKEAEATRILDETIDMVASDRIPVCYTAPHNPLDMVGIFGAEICAYDTLTPEQQETCKERFTGSMLDELRKITLSGYWSMCPRETAQAMIDALDALDRLALFAVPTTTIYGEEYNTATLASAWNREHENDTPLRE